MNSTFAANELRNIPNPKEFASSHYATLKKAMRKGGADVPGYEPLWSPAGDTFVKSSKLSVSTLLGSSPHLVPNRRELQLYMKSAGADGRSATYLHIDARLKPGVWKKELFSVTHFSGQGALITKIVMPRPWSPGQLEIHQVNLPDNSSIPPTYTKRVGPDFSVEESAPGEAAYPRNFVYGMFDQAKELDSMLRIPGRSLDSLAANFDNALCGVKPPYWDGATKG